MVKAECMTGVLRRHYQLIRNVTFVSAANKSITDAIKAVVILDKNTEIYGELFTRIDAANAILTQHNDDMTAP